MIAARSSYDSCIPAPLRSLPARGNEMERLAEYDSIVDGSLRWRCSLDNPTFTWDAEGFEKARTLLHRCNRQIFSYSLIRSLVRVLARRQ